MSLFPKKKWSIPLNCFILVYSCRRGGQNLPTFVAHNFPGVYNIMAVVNTGKLSSFILFCSHYVVCEKFDNKKQMSLTKKIWCQIIVIFSLICFHFHPSSSVAVSANVLFICIMQYVFSCWSLEGGWKFPSICYARCNCFEQSHTQAKHTLMLKI